MSWRRVFRLICLPYAGGGSPIFRAWGSRLPKQIEVLPIELPGRLSRIREKPISNMNSLVDFLLGQIHPFLDEPFAIFGHSMGALAAFETARALRRRFGCTPRKLFIAAHRAPQIPSHTPPIHKLPDKDFFRQLEKLGGTPAEILKNEELMKLMLPTLRADFECIETYRYQPEPPLECPLLVCGGLQDSEVREAELEDWRSQTSSSFSLHMLPGNHFFIQSHREALLETISTDLAHLAKDQS